VHSERGARLPQRQYATCSLRVKECDSSRRSHIRSVRGVTPRAINPVCAAYRIVNFCGAGGATIGDRCFLNLRFQVFPSHLGEIEAASRERDRDRTRRRSTTTRCRTGKCRSVRGGYYRPWERKRTRGGVMTWALPVGEQVKQRPPRRRGEKKTEGGTRAAPFDSAGADRIRISGGKVTDDKKSMTGRAGLNEIPNAAAASQDRTKSR
jgi:hypothetical protein